MGADLVITGPQTHMTDVQEGLHNLIGFNEITNAVRDSLTARYIYVFAQDVFGNGILNGATPMCIGTDRFVIRGVEECLLRGHLAADFIEVDTQQTERWTLFLTAQP